MQAIEISGLSVSLGTHQVLIDVSLSVEPGSFVAIAGPNGAGKSTLLEVLLGLVPPKSGRLRIFEQPLDRVAPEWIGYVPQIKTLDRSFPALSCELVASGLSRRWPWRVCRTDHNAAVEYLELVGAGHLAHRPLRALSGGELQRVYLARALVRRPRLILLDEPATGVDVSGERDMYHILDDYHRRAEATTLMVTHDWVTALHHASHALLLDRRVISYGPPAAALSHAHLVQAFGHSQHAHREGSGFAPSQPDDGGPDG